MARPGKSSLSIRQTYSSDKVQSLLNDLTAYVSKTFDVRSGHVVIIGIQTRGFLLAQRIGQKLYEQRTPVPVGALDITLYRDDVRTSGIQPMVGDTHLDFDIDNKIVVLIDDVLFTGRTVRAALDELMDYGRPRSIHLVVLIDRGHRELPISAEFSALKINTARQEAVNLHLLESDQVEEIVIGEALK